MTQKERILEYIDKHGSITQGEAFGLRIARLAARIMEIRQDGVDIRCEMISGKNEYGAYRYGKYSRPT